MGNDTSKSSNRMAISAMSHMMKITKPQLIALRDRCMFDSDKGDDINTPSGYRLSRTKFLDAMREMKVADEPDFQVMEKLFIMWDEDGEEWVDPVSDVVIDIRRRFHVFTHAMYVCDLPAHVRTAFYLILYAIIVPNKVGVFRWNKSISISDGCRDKVTICF